MTILVVGDLAPSRRAEVAAAAAGQPVRQVGAILGSEPDDGVVAAVGVTGQADRLLELFPGLRWIHSAAAGVDGLLTPRLRDSAVTLTSATGNGAVPLAEQALLLMLMLDRDAPRWLRAQHDHRWDRYSHGELFGRTLGIIGLGNSGNHLARIGAALGMRVLALSRHPRRAEHPEVERCFAPDELHVFLPQCDVVVITAVLTADTAGLIGGAELGLMKSDALLVCVSRGGIIDDDALVAALRSGAIGGAGIDAHGVEPLPPDSPFWDLPNVIITPHNGATTPQTAERGWQILVDNLDRFVNGRPLVNVVDKEAGY